MTVGRRSLHRAAASRPASPIPNLLTMPMRTSALCGAGLPRPDRPAITRQPDRRAWDPAVRDGGRLAQPNIEIGGCLTPERL